METGLRLLMRDGAIHVTFYPRLSAPHYSELMAVVERAGTKDELRTALHALTAKWGSRVEFDDT